MTEAQQISIRTTRLEMDLRYELRRKHINVKEVLRLRDELALMRAGKLIPIWDEETGTWKWERA